MDDGSRLPRRGPAKVIDWIQGLFSGVFHFFKGEQEDSVTEKEIISMVDEAHEKGVLQKDEAEMIQNIFAFEDKEVGVVMTHRSSVAAFAMDDLLKDVVNHMMEEENSRYPVCGEDMDDIRGLIHYKDALKFFTQNPWAKFKPLKELPGLIRKATFVPETRHIGQLFRTMQARQVHMAVVVDEYGQTAGIVTMEDLIEEIVGDIFDEYDESRDTFRTQVDNSIIIDGLASLDDVEQELDIEFGDVEMETLNGYLTELLGHIPSREDLDKEIVANGYRFKILSLGNRTIGRVRAEKINDKEEKNISNQYRPAALPRADGRDCYVWSGPSTCRFQACAAASDRYTQHRGEPGQPHCCRQSCSRKQAEDAGNDCQPRPEGTARAYRQSAKGHRPQKVGT